MFNKTALAASIALISGTATAATWNATAPVLTAAIHTKQGIEDVTEATGVANTNAMLVLGAEYAANDTITFTNTVAKSTNANWPTSLVTATKVGAQATSSAATFAKAVTTIATAANHTYVMGDRFTLTTDSTNTAYRVVNAGSGTKVLSFTPGLAESMGNGVDVDPITSTVSFGLINSTDTAATYRVTSTAGAGSHINAQLIAPTLSLSPAGLTAAANTISFAAATATGLAMDSNSSARQTASSAEEYALTVTTGFDGIVDVENDRKDFTASTLTSSGGATLSTRDTMVYALTNSAGTNGTVTANGTSTTAVTAVVATETASVMTVAGDWAFLDNATTAGIQSTSALATGPFNTNGASDTAVGTAAINTSGDLTVTFASGDGTGWGAATTGNLAVVSDQSAAIPIQSYTASHTFTYNSSTTTGNTKTLTAAAGSWTLNGASITAYGVPWSSATQKFLWVGNSGATDAAVEASVEYGGTTYGPYSVGTVAAKSQAKVNTALDTALSGAGVDTSAWSRANVTVTSAVKAANVVLNASYKHIADADRLGIPTSDDIDGTTK
jgi:hypothetical protein